MPNDGNGGSSMNGTLNGEAAIVNDPTRGPVLSLNGAAGSYVAINSPVTDLSGTAVGPFRPGSTRRIGR